MKSIKEYSSLENEQSLDNPNWDEMRELGKKMIDDSIDFLQKIDQKPVWKKIPKKTKDFLNANLPQESMDPNEVYAEFLEHVFPYPKGNIHPRFFSWVQGNGTLFGAFADFLASVMNPNVTIGEHSSMYVENEVLNWSKEILNYPKSSSGILLSGGSMANITGLIIARNSYGNLNIRKNGLRKISAPMVFYCSSETHACMQKAAEAMGIGSDGVKKVAVDENRRIRTDLLEKMIEDDKKKDLIPFAVVGNAGTVNTGVIDDLAKISEICKKHKLWFHIDGAYGALAKISDEYCDELKAIELADSVAFDFHKWFFINYEVGCLLVKDAKKHRDSFAIEPNYLLAHDRGLASGPDSFNNFGMELSRGFKALKIWMSLKENGVEKYKKIISQNIAQAAYLEGLIRREKDLELMSEASLSIVCYRFKKEDLDVEKLNILNKEILIRLQEEGIAAPSYTILNGNYVIRACITNHRTKKKDLEILVKETIRIGEEMLAEK